MFHGRHPGAEEKKADFSRRIPPYSCVKAKLSGAHAQFEWYRGY